MELVTWNNFVKKTNSTRQPNTQGVTRTIHLKENTDIINPVFLLKDIDFSITYCKWENRYYFVDNKVIGTNKVFELHCSLDHLATFKSNVGGTTAYIEYAQTGYNPNIVDGRISTEYEMRSKVITSAITAINPSLDISYGTFIVQVKGCKNQNGISTETPEVVYNTGGVITYAMDYTAFQNFAEKFCNLQYSSEISINTLLEDLQKQMGSYYNAIVRCYFLPIHFNNTFNNEYYKQTTGDGYKGFYIGNYAFTISSGIRVVLPFQSYAYQLIEIPLELYYTDWRNKSPYTNISLFLPFYGSVSLNVDDYLKAGVNTITIDVRLDYKTGDIEYQIVNPFTEVEPSLRPYEVYTCNICADIPLVQQQRDGISSINSIFGVMSNTIGLGASIVTGSGMGIAQSTNGLASSLFNSYVDMNKRTFTGITNTSSIVINNSHDNVIKLAIYTHNTVVEPLSIASTQGIPTQRQDLISNHSGYIQCRNASIDGNMMDSERQTLNNFLNGGFYYE